MPPPDSRSKVIVRKLPPGISEEEVRAAIDGVAQGKYDWFSFVPGKTSLKRIKHSRVYLNFKDSAEVFKFRAQFGGHAFVNKKGAQYKCTVEYAPYQKIPREKAKEDPREGTYEKDADFLAFKQQIEGEPDMLPSAEVQLDAKEQEKKAALLSGVPEVKKPKITPLMQFLFERHSLKPEKKATILVPIKKKPSKPAMPLPAASADADLPPHLTSKAASAQAAPAKPPRVQQPIATAKLLRSGSDAAGKPPGYTQASPSGKGKRAHDQPAHRDNHTAAAAGSSTAPNSWPGSGSGKQTRQQDSRAASPAPEGTKSPAVGRKVVPIPLDKLGRREGPRADSRDSGGAAAKAGGSTDAQDADGKPGRKVRPGFQTWTPRRGRADSPIEEEAGGQDSALHAAKAAAAAALGSAQKARQTPDLGGDTWGPSQPPGSGWDDDPAPSLQDPPSHNPGHGSNDSFRGRGGGPRGRGPAGRPVDPFSSTAEASSARMPDPLPGTGWDDAPVTQSQPPLAAPQQDQRGRGRGRVRGRGRGRGYGSDGPPGGFNAQPAQSSGPSSSINPQTVIIKKRPQPAEPASG